MPLPTARETLYALTHPEMGHWGKVSKLADKYEHPGGKRFGVSGTTAIATALGIEWSELLRILKVFKAIDADGDARVSLHELLTFLDLDPTRLTKRVFSVFDADGDARIDFREFTFALYQFCSANPHGLLLLYFRCFSRRTADATYVLDDAGRRMFLDFLYPDGSLPDDRRRTARALARLSRNPRDGVTLSSWTAWIESHALHSLRLAEIQARLVQCCGGEPCWDKIERRRRDYFGEASWHDVETYVMSAHGLHATEAATATTSPRKPEPGDDDDNEEAEVVTVSKRQRRAVPDPAAAAAPRRRPRLTSAARVAPLPRRRRPALDGKENDRVFYKKHAS